MHYYTWKKLHTIVETLSQSGDKKVLLEEALLELNKINDVRVPPKFRNQISAIKENLLPPENEQQIMDSNYVFPQIQNLTEDEADEIIHTICKLESFMNPN